MKRVAPPSFPHGFLVSCVSLRARVWLRSRASSLTLYIDSDALEGSMIRSCLPLGFCRRFLSYAAFSYKTAAPHPAEPKNLDLLMVVPRIRSRTDGTHAEKVRAQHGIQFIINYPDNLLLWQPAICVGLYRADLLLRRLLRIIPCALEPYCLFSSK